MQDEKTIADIQVAARRTYQSKRIPTMQPDKTLIEISNHWIDTLKPAINLSHAEEVYSIVDYKLGNICPHVEQYRINKRNLSAVSFNLLFMEMMADLLHFQDMQTMEYIEYFFSKYMRQIEAYHHNNVEATFYNQIYSQYTGKKEYSYLPYLKLASAGSFFLAFHEWTHTEPEMLSSTQHLFLSDQDMLPCFQDTSGKLNNNLLEEYCCDFTALCLCIGRNLEKSLGLSQKEFISYAVISLSIPGLYDFFSGQSKVNEGIHQGPTMDELEKALNTRIKTLEVAVRKSENSGWDFEPGAIEYAVKYSKIIFRFLHMVGEYYQTRYIPRVEEFNALPDQVQASFTYEIPVSDWILVK